MCLVSVSVNGWLKVEILFFVLFSSCSFRVLFRELGLLFVRSCLFCVLMMMMMLFVVVVRDRMLIFVFEFCSVCVGGIVNCRRSVNVRRIFWI